MSTLVAMYGWDRSLGLGPKRLETTVQAQMRKKKLQK